MLNIPNHKGNANQIKTTMRYHPIPIRMTIIKKTKGKKKKREKKKKDEKTIDGEDVKKMEPLSTIGGNVN